MFCASLYFHGYLFYLHPNKINQHKACLLHTTLSFKMPIRRFSIALSLLLLVSCSTQKNTWLSRSYNNLTARYNILFNGQQSFLRGDQQLTQTQAEIGSASC